MRTGITLLIVAAAIALTSCKGTGHAGATSSAGSNTIAGAASNVAPVTVSSGPNGTAIVNKLYTSVKICAPGSATVCQTIDHIEVDTGASGLRVFAEVLQPPVASALPQMVDANNNSIVECAQYADGYAWGPVVTADMTISGETAVSLPMQVIGSSNFPTAPSPGCTGVGPSLGSVLAFGANGTIGVSVLAQDCGSDCALSLDTTINPGFYYACSSPTSCTITTVHLIATSSDPTQQVVNPVTLFAKDNNGVIIELPSVAATGAATVTGAMVFGIDTQTNNATSTSATVLTVNPVTAEVSTTFNLTGYPHSFFDTGSNGIFFNAKTLTALTACTGAVSAVFYCPTTTQNYSATVLSTANVAINVSFSVANADTLAAGGTSLLAFSNLAGTSSTGGVFDWGLPFFYGRNIYYAFEGKATIVANGPYVSF